MQLRRAFWYSLEASEVSQSEKSIVDGMLPIIKTDLNFGHFYVNIIIILIFKSSYNLIVFY